MNPTLDMQTEHVLGSNVKMGKCENAVNGRTREKPHWKYSDIFLSECNVRHSN